MKNFLLIFFSGLSLTSFTVQDYSYCYCGSFEQGISTWRIVDGGCCTGVLYNHEASFDKYVQEGESWHWIGRERISAIEARNSCCNKPLDV